jgi:hypothetical protein
LFCQCRVFCFKIGKFVSCSSFGFRAVSHTYKGLPYITIIFTILPGFFPGTFSISLFMCYLSHVEFSLTQEWNKELTGLFDY